MEKKTKKKKQKKQNKKKKKVICCLVKYNVHLPSKELDLRFLSLLCCILKNTHTKKKHKKKTHTQKKQQNIKQIGSYGTRGVRNPGRDMSILFLKLLRQFNILFGQLDNFIGQHIIVLCGFTICTAFSIRSIVRQAKTDQPAHLHSLIRVFAEHSAGSPYTVFNLNFL